MIQPSPGVSVEKGDFNEEGDEFKLVWDCYHSLGANIEALREGSTKSSNK